MKRVTVLTLCFLSLFLVATEKAHGLEVRRSPRVPWGSWDRCVPVGRGKVPDGLALPLTLYLAETWGFASPPGSEPWWVRYMVVIDQGLHASVVPTERGKRDSAPGELTLWNAYFSPDPESAFIWGGSMISPAESWNATVGMVINFLDRELKRMSSLAHNQEPQRDFADERIYVTSGIAPDPSYQPRFGVIQTQYKGLTMSSAIYASEIWPLPSTLKNPLPGMRVLDLRKIRDFLLGYELDFANAPYCSDALKNPKVKVSAPGTWWRSW